MLGEKGFNEMDMNLLKHLLFNQKPLAFIRTQCDSAIRGILDEQFEEVFHIFGCSDVGEKGMLVMNFLYVGEDRNPNVC